MDNWAVIKEKIRNDIPVYSIVIGYIAYYNNYIYGNIEIRFYAVARN